MGMVPVVSRNWSGTLSSLMDCKKEILLLKIVRWLPVSCLFCFMDDRMKILVFDSGLLFSLQGLFAKDESHIGPSEPNTSSDSLTESIIPLQCKHDEPTQWSMASAPGATKLMLNITAKRATIIFLVKEFISVKTEI